MGKAPILIADPDGRVASLAAHGLRKEGFDVVVAHRGEEALAMLAGVPSLVLCEYALPGLDGPTLCENVRREPATREVRFLLFSRRHDRAERERAAAVGADDLLVKPVYARDLLTLARLFAGKPRTASTLEGDLHSLPLFYLLRALTSGGLSGEVSLPQEKACVQFREGRIVGAWAGEASGEPVLSRLLVLSEGPFSLELKPIVVRGSMSYSLRDLVTHDEPRRRRFEKAVSLMGGAGVRLVIDFAGLTRELPRLPASIEKIVRLFDGTRTLGEALRASDLEEVMSAEAVLRLRMAGVLVPPKAGEAPKGEVKLFEPRDDQPLLEMSSLFPEDRPKPVEVPEGSAHDVRDWMDEIAQRTPIQDLLAVEDGGWVAQHAGEASKQLLEAAGEEAVADIDRQIAALEGHAPPLPASRPAPVVPVTPAPVAAAPETLKPAPAPEPTPAPQPPAAAPAVPEPVPAPALPAPHSHAHGHAHGHDPDEEAFFSSEPVASPATTSATKVVIVLGALALGIGLGVLIFKPRQPVPATTPQAIIAPVDTPARLEAPQPIPDPVPAALETADAAALPDDAGAPEAADAGIEPADAATVAVADAGAPAEPAGVDVNALLAKGEALYERGNAIGALKPLEAAAAAAPDHAGVQVLLALARFDTGKVEAAEATARRAIELAPDNARAHLALGTVLQERGQIAAARAEYETYLRLDPKGRFAGDVRQILNTLR